MLMKAKGHKRVKEELGIWRLQKALEGYGISENSCPSGLYAFYLGNWLTDYSLFEDQQDDLSGAKPEGNSFEVIIHTSMFLRGYCIRNTKI
jgi:hypothetical protein